MEKKLGWHERSFECGGGGNIRMLALTVKYILVVYPFFYFRVG
jgi:hypothetical protein